MDAVIQRILANAQQAPDTSDDDIDQYENPVDMLVSQEGIWIEGNYKRLMTIWKGLKGLCSKVMPDHPELLADANFRVFASFAYRWTAAESDSDDEDTMNTITQTASGLAEAQPDPDPEAGPGPEADSPAAPAMQSQ